MKTATAAILASASLATAADERILGAYIFHRHGDRTAKAWAPVNLTALGADEAHSSGTFYHDRYVSASSPLRIAGLSSGEVVLSQLSVTSPDDAVLHNSADTFLQGFYPPTGTAYALRNGSKVTAPLDGYQYIPVNAIATAATASKAESNGWLQGSSGCDKGVASSNEYFTTPEYKAVLADTNSFYQSLLPVINSTYDAAAANFKNGYTIFDYVNVAMIHNQTVPSSDLITNSTFQKLQTLASLHEWNLAYNSSDPVRAIAGSVLAGQIVDALTDIVNGKKGAPRFNAQFGAYGTFMSFFGLAALPKANPDFFGICDYASSMTFELVTTSTAAKPSPDDVSVRFLFSNGTAAQHGLTQYPLFGGSDNSISWKAFTDGMNKFAVLDNNHYCDLCGSTSAVCAANSTASASGNNNNGTSSDSGSGSGSGGMSKAVAGVIGALVTLVVVLGLEALVLLVGGLRLVKKSTLAAPRGVETAGSKTQ